MATRTAAQEEFDAIISKASTSERLTDRHPADDADYRHDADHSDVDEEDEHTQKRIDDSMRVPNFSRSGGGGGGEALRLPHRDFDSGRTTGVKGVIADARSYEEARQQQSGNFKSMASGGRGGGAAAAAAATSRADKRSSRVTFLHDDGEGSASEDDSFIERWRQSRREQLLRDGNDIRNRRTSPSVRRYGRFDDVDAMGYLDAIEKVGRDTVVVVFVHDPESAVSQVISDALEPLVPANPAIHFVRVHYDDIEFDLAAVPAILAYKNQGDLFANLTYIIGQIPNDTMFDTDALEAILRKNKVL